MLVRHWIYICIFSGLKPSTQRSPSYEDTLRKCQSLTRHSSSPVSSNSDLSGQPVFRQNSCPIGSTSPGKPAIAPKPSGSPAVPLKPVRFEHKKIAHLPPSGILHSRSPSANGRKPVVNQAFLNDLHHAMNQKRNTQNNQKFPINASEDNFSGGERPFPNRFSSGEYENVQQQLNSSSSTSKIPPPPKRNNETHLTWDRT